MKNVTIEWQKTIHQEGFNNLTSLKQTFDGGFIICGYSTILGNGHINTSLIVKLNADGSTAWSKLLSDTINNYARHICETSDSGYVVAGMTNKHGENSTLKGDWWILKLDRSGNEIWKKTYGGSDPDEAKYIIETENGGLMVAGYTTSNDGDVTGFHGKPWMSADFWVVALNTNGELQWQKCYGGSSWDEAEKIIQTKDLGFLIVGRSASVDQDIKNNIGDFDACIFKIDSIGNILWQKNLGKQERDFGFNIAEISDTTLRISGISKIKDKKSVFNSVIYTLSNNGEIISETSPFDFKMETILNTNGFLGYRNPKNNENSGICLFETDSTLNILWEICLSDFNEGNVSEFLPIGNNQYVLGAMNMVNNDGDYFIVKLSISN